MRFLLFILFLTGATFSAGCNTALKCQREKALLRAEILDLEDKYYALLAETGGEVVETISDEVILENGPEIFYGTGVGEVVEEQIPLVSGEPLSHGSAVKQPSPATPRSKRSGILERFRGSGQRGSAQPTERPAVQPVEKPSILETPKSTGELPPPQASRGNRNGRQGTRNATEGNLTGTNVGFSSAINDRAAAKKIVINHAASHGKNTDGLPGDDAVNLVIQPVSSDGAIVSQAGDLTVSITDPNAADGQQQIGYWSFLASETALFFAKDEYGNEGILLDLPWEEHIPTGKQLDVFVRFETPEGIVMATKSKLYIDPPAIEVGTPVLKVDNRGWYQQQTRVTSNGADAAWKPSR